MKSITIHGIDDPLAKLIKSKAEVEGLSVNKTIKRILEQSLGVEPKDREGNRAHFEEFCGLWSRAEFEEFEKATGEFRQINPEEWK